jgi:energy-coupling factor transport system ATP-binding protein
MSEVELEGVYYRYPNGVAALDGIDLSVGRGERLAITGATGAGKSTVVRHLNGLLRPSAGRVTVDGHDTSKAPVARLARRVGVVFQDPDQQLFDRTVRDEVTVGPRNFGLRGSDLAFRVDAALASAGLSASAQTHPFDLGYSRRKLVAVAAVLAMETPIVVIDEPTTGQDLRSIERIESIVEMLRRDGRTLIFVSHDRHFVERNADRVVRLENGRLTTP